MSGNISLRHLATVVLGFFCCLGSSTQLQAYDTPEPSKSVQASAKVAELTTGLDAPQAIGRFLNNNLPNSTPGSTVSEWEAVNAFPNLTIMDPVDMKEYPGSNRYIVAGKDGRVWTFENNPNVSTKTLFLDIRSRTRTAGDCGILGLVFHPEFGQAGSPNRNYIYIYYRYTQQKGRGDQLAYVRLSRFTVPDGQQTANQGSEYVMIQQYDRHDWHNGGSMFFHPDDGFLYLIIGDEGGAYDEFNSAQKINHSLMSGILRIDVDRRGGNVSHPIRRQPQAPVDPPSGWPGTFSQGYYIPNDNPWNNPNGSVLEEFWAIGMRSPHRMWFDEPTGDIWFGDIGQGAREEVTIIRRAGNAQWPYREGFRNGFKPKPNNLIGTETPPLLDYNRSIGSSVIGGFVYREGKWASSLGGKYLFTDNVVQNIWAVDYYNSGSKDMELIATVPFVTDNWKDGPSHMFCDNTGEVFILQLGGHNRELGKIYKLAPKSSSGINAPQRLSQTGAFQNLDDLTPNPGIIPYGVNIPFWSDGALKRRWVALPNDGSHNAANEKINFSEDGTWEFPNGSVFIKHMDLRIDDTDPSRVKKIETRFMVRGNDGSYYSLTYRWRENESDADLVESSTGADRVININTANGSRQYVWRYPSSTECRTCHNSGAKQILGLNSRQLNHDIFYPSSGRTGNQLTTMNHLNWFNTNLTEEEILNFTTLPNLDDNTVSAEDKARAYLDVNCAYCHRPNGIKANFDARFTTPLANQNLILAEPDDNLGISGARIIAPGDIGRSVIFHRVNSLEEGVMMPPLTKKVVDNQGITLLRNWINSMEQVCLDPPSLSVTPVNPLNCGEPGGVNVIANPIGGNFELRNSANEVVSDLDNLPIGTYTYTYVQGPCSEAGTFDIVSPGGPQVSLDPIEGVEIIDAPFALTGGSPAGGVYAGPGVQNGTFSPEVAGPGKHKISYTVENARGCVGSDTIIVAVIAENLSQAITFEEIPDKVTIDVPFELQAFSSAELPVTVEIIEGPATLDGNLIVLDKTAGTVRIRATQEGNGIFGPATPITRSFEVRRSSQGFSFGIGDSVTTIQPPFNPRVIASSGLPVTYSFVSGPADVAPDGTITLDGTTGVLTFRVEQEGNETYLPNEEDVSLRIVKAEQTVSVEPVDNKSVTSSAFEINASSSVGLPVTLELIEGPAIISENVCILVGDTGRVVLEARQLGNETYREARPVQISFDVKLKTQEITWEDVPDSISVLSSPMAITAIASSGLPVTAVVIDGPGSILQDSLVLDHQFGNIVIEIRQAGNHTYIEAEPVQFTISLHKATQEITFSQIPALVPLDMNAFALKADAGDELEVSFEVVRGPAFVVAGDTLKFSGIPGEVEVRAFHQGNELYHPASAYQNFAISRDISIGDSVIVSNKKGLDPAAVGIRIYPIPATDKLNITWGNASRQVETIEIYSLQGQLITYMRKNDIQLLRAVELSVNNLAKGSYLLKLTDNKNQHYQVMWSKH